MCQLMGMNCAALTDFTFSFRGFARRGGDTDVHSHGWGLCFYEGRGVRAFHDPDPASESRLAEFLQTYPVKTRHRRRRRRAASSLRSSFRSARFRLRSDRGVSVSVEFGPPSPRPRASAFGARPSSAAVSLGLPVDGAPGQSVRTLPVSADSCPASTRALDRLSRFDAVGAAFLAPRLSIPRIGRELTPTVRFSSRPVAQKPSRRSSG
ncbi:hypothetical protein ACHAWF_008038 [Thalassiosira exigua]